MSIIMKNSKTDNEETNNDVVQSCSIAVNSYVNVTNVFMQL